MSGWFDEGTDDDAGAEPHSDPSGSTDGSAHRESPEPDDDASDEGGGRGEHYRVKGDDLLARVKQIVREGNVRKITIRNEADEVLLSFPLAAGVLGAALLPMWAAIGAVAALVGNCSIDVERRE